MKKWQLSKACRQMKTPKQQSYSFVMNEFEQIDHQEDFKDDKYHLDLENQFYEEQDEPNYVEETEDDVYTILAQKEKDLLLAAELGKALLEKNEELTQKYEKLQEDYSQHAEVRNYVY